MNDDSLSVARVTSVFVLIYVFQGGIFIFFGPLFTICYYTICIIHITRILRVLKESSAVNFLSFLLLFIMAKVTKSDTVDHTHAYNISSVGRVNGFTIL